MRATNSAWWSTILPFALGSVMVASGCAGTCCGSQGSPPAASAPSSAAASAGQPANSAAPPATPTASALAAPAPLPSASAPPAPVASAAAPAEPEKLPNVKVVNIGMHIGGGPNDNETKEPIRASVQPHFDAFRRCFALVSDQSKAGDFGVDLLIERDGGKAAISHPRTALQGDGFTDCMVKAFEVIDFRKPRKGKTTVSYSLRFTPIK